MTMPTGPRRDARTDEAQTAAEIFRVPILLGLATVVVVALAR